MTSLLQILNNSAYQFYFLVVDNFLNINLPKLTCLDPISTDKLNINLKYKNSGFLLANPTTIKYINNQTVLTQKIPIIVPFKPSAKIEFICQQNQWNLASNKYQLSRFLEDKIKFYRLCIDNELPVLPCIIGPLSKKIFEKAQDKLGRYLVVQGRHGWAGNNSFLTNNWKDISQKMPTGSMVKISAFIKSYSLINNCCLTHKGLIQSPPGLQYTGINPLTNNPLATVGRQWPSYAPENIKQQVFEITKKFSQVLIKYRYLGFFGLDFLVQGDRVYIIECNPRLTASFDFYTQIESRLKYNPIFLHHLAAFINIKHDFDIKNENNRFSDQRICGSEITIKNNLGTTIKRYREKNSLFLSPVDLLNHPEQLAKYYERKTPNQN